MQRVYPVMQMQSCFIKQNFTAESVISLFLLLHYHISLTHNSPVTKKEMLLPYILWVTELYRKIYIY